MKKSPDETCISTDSYGEGWMVKILLENIEEAEVLLSAEAYQNLIGV